MTGIAVTLAANNFSSMMDNTSRYLFGIFSKHPQRRVLCDAYIAAVRTFEENLNKEYKKELDSLTAFEITHRELQGADEERYKEQRCLFEATKAQELVHRELQMRFGFVHMPFCELRDETRKFTPDRWFTVLAETPFEPDFKAVSRDQVEQFRKQIFFSSDLDCFFFEHLHESPFVNRFISHASTQKQLVLLQPLFTQYGLPEEPGKLSADLVKKVPATDRIVLFMNALFEAFRACKAVQKASVALEGDLKQCAVQAAFTAGSPREVEKEKQAVLELCKKVEDVKKQKSPRITYPEKQNELSNHVIREMSHCYARIQDLCTLLDAHVTDLQRDMGPGDMGRQLTAYQETLKAILPLFEQCVPRRAPPFTNLISRLRLSGDT